MGGWAAYPAIKDVVLFILAIYAAVLSTVNFWRAIQKERRSIRVLASTAMPTDGPALGPPYVKLEAVNDGHRVVSVSLIAFQLPNRSRMFSMTSNGLPGMPDTQLPAQLGEGQIAHKFMSYADVGRALIAHGITTKTELTPVAEDTVGGCYLGKPWMVDPHEFLQMGQD